MARVRALPGATQVTAASVVPLGPNDERRGVTIDGYTPPGDGAPLSMANNVVWPGYFEVMGIPLVAGRTFTEADGRPGGPLVAIVNQTMATRYWPSGDPIGRTIRLGDQRAEVVGIVKDIVYYTLGEAPLPYLYLAYGPGQPYQRRPDLPRPHQPRPGGDGAPAVAGAAGAGSAGPRRQRHGLRGAACGGAVSGAGDGLAEHRLRGPRPGAAARRHLRRDVVCRGGTAPRVGAARRAGRRSGALRAGVVRRALLWGAPGALAGALVALGLAQLLRGTLVGVSALDPWSLAGGAVAVLITSGLAAYVPARRVGRLDLAAELRQ